MLQRADVCLQLSFMWVVDVSASKKIKENQLSWYCSHLKCSKQLNIAFILYKTIQFSCDVRPTGTCLSGEQKQCFALQPSFDDLFNSNLAKMPDSCCAIGSINQSVHLQLPKECRVLIVY